MEDREIINLYWERNSNAIKETASKYGGYCKSIAKNILGNDNTKLSVNYHNNDDKAVICGIERTD